MPNDFEIGRKPDYKLSVLSKSNEHKGNVGVAWENKDGSISIKLNPFVTLAAIQELIITLFPNEDTWTKKRKKPQPEE